MRSFIFQGTMLAVVALWATPSWAVLYGFENISNINPANAAIGEAQLFVEVTDAGSNQTLFNFSNTGPEPSSITAVYFDGDVLDSIDSIINGTGVSFSEGAAPPDLPGGNSLVPPFDTDHAADSDTGPGGAANGVDPGESLGILFDLVSGSAFADVIAALNDHSLRIGLQVQSIGEDEGSEQFVNGPPVPEASSLLVWLVSGCTGVALLHFRRRRASAA